MQKECTSTKLLVLVHSIHNSLCPSPFLCYRHKIVIYDSGCEEQISKFVYSCKISPSLSQNYHQFQHSWVNESPDDNQIFNQSIFQILILELVLWVLCFLWIIPLLFAIYRSYIVEGNKK